MASVLVVGGGLAGLTAAWRLQREGHQVQVLEAEATAGGRMRAEPRDGFVLDRGAQFIASAYRNLHGVIDALGLASQVRPLRHARNAVLRDGALHPADADSPLQVLASPLLTARGKLRLPRLLFEAWRHRRRIDPWHPERAASIDDEDMASWLSRTVGREAFEYLIAPAFSSTFDSEPEDLSAVFALQAIRFTSLGFRLQSLPGGVGTLTRALAEALDVRTGARVLSVETGTQGARVRFRAADGEHEVHADAAVVAVPGSRVTDCCPKLSPAERGFFDGVRYVRGMIAFLLFDEAPDALPYYGVAFPRPEKIGLYGLAVDHWKEGAAPPGAGLVNCALTEAAARKLWDEPDAAVVAHVLSELARTPVGVLAPSQTVVHRWDPMLPQFRAGYTRRLAAFLARSERSPRLAFAGDYLVGPYTEGACTSGLRAAEELGAELR
ncbi:MAG: protoporphyrinogen/coproporphyrinogen oxidase [Myxococcota bacterium]